MSLPSSTIPAANPGKCSCCMKSFMMLSARGKAALILVSLSLSENTGALYIAASPVAEVAVFALFWSVDVRQAVQEKKIHPRTM